MLADAVIYHPSLAHYIKFQSTLVGRDKVLRLLQYFARFYAWYLLRTDRPQSSIAPFAALKKQAGQVRKAIRVGKFLEHLRAASVAADAPVSAAEASSPADQLLRYATVGRQIGYTGFLGGDSLTVLDTLGIRKWEGAKRAQREAWRFWTFGLMCSVVAQTLTLRKLKMREAKIDKKDGEGVVESKRIAK
jgi:peroxin-11B